MEQKQKSSKKSTGFLVGLILGGIAFAAGCIFLVYASMGQILEKEEPGDVYEAEAEDEYAYANVQYMTESFAFYEVNAKLQFYMIFDKDWNPAILCLKDENLKDYQKYIDWLYSESYENEPENIMVKGYSQRIDQELKDLAIEVFEEHFGTGYVDQTNFSDWFGGYYLNVAPKNTAYGVSNAGIILTVAGLVTMIVCGVLWKGRKGKEELANGMSSDGTYISLNQDASAIGIIGAADGDTSIPSAYQNTLPFEEGNSTGGLGLLGAIVGALIGGVVWALVAILGYVSGWVGLLVMWLSFQGYRIFVKKEDKMGRVISIVASLLVIALATYVAGAWTYYQLLNASIPGYTTFGEAFLSLPRYLTQYDEWSIFLGNLGLGYVFVGVASIYLLGGKNRKNKKKEKQDLPSNLK